MWPTSQQSDQFASYYPTGTFQFNNVPPNSIPVVDFNSLPQNVSNGNSINLVLSGGATLTTGGTVTLDASSCLSTDGNGNTITNVILFPTSPITTTSTPITVTVVNNATSAIGCVVNASDGSTTAPLQVYIGNYGVTVNRVKRK